MIITILSKKDKFIKDNGRMIKDMEKGNFGG